MLNFFKNRFNKKSNNKQLINSRFNFYNIGFHGDKYLLKVVDLIGKNSICFFETGSNVGSTLSYFSKKFKNAKCYSCEPDLDAFNHSRKNAEAFNCKIYNETSQLFLKRIKNEFSEHFKDASAFWLDAHGYGFDWPLIEEMQFIMNNFKEYYILIDDFEVPGIPEFGFDVYNNQVCSHEYIKNHLTKQEYYIYYPTYTEKTSPHHPLRGWGLYSNKRIDFINNGIDFVREIKVNS